MHIDIIVPQAEIDKAKMRNHPNTQHLCGKSAQEAEAWFDEQTTTREGLLKVMKHIFLMLHCKAH